MQKDEEKWRGYDLDELRIQRIVNLTKIDIDHMRMKQLTDRYTGKSGAKVSHSLFSKVMGAFDYIDYGIIAFQLGKRILSFVKRHRR